MLSTPLLAVYQHHENSTEVVFNMLIYT